jgi:hypothetical protein
MPTILLEETHQSGKDNWRGILTDVAPNLKSLLEYPVKRNNEQIFYDVQGIPRLVIAFDEYQKVSRVHVFEEWSSTPVASLMINTNGNVEKVSYVGRATKQLEKEVIYDGEGKPYLEKFYNQERLQHLAWYVGNDKLTFSTEEEFIQEVLRQHTVAEDSVINTVRMYDQALLRTKLKRRVFVVDQPIFVQNDWREGVVPEMQTLLYTALSAEDQVVVQSDYQKQLLLQEFPYMREHVIVEVPELQIQTEKTSQPMAGRFLVTVSAEQIDAIDQLLNEFNDGDAWDTDGIVDTLYIVTADEKVTAHINDKIAEFQITDVVEIIDDPAQALMLAQNATVLVLPDAFIIPDALLQGLRNGQKLIVLDETDDLKIFTTKYPQVERVENWLTLTEKDV